MVNLKDFEKLKFKSATEESSILGGQKKDTTCTEEVTTNQGCGDTTKTLYNEDGSVCCEETTDLCCDT